MIHPARIRGMIHPARIRGTIHPARKAIRRSQARQAQARKALDPAARRTRPATHRSPEEIRTTARTQSPTRMEVRRANLERVTDKTIEAKGRSCPACTLLAGLGEDQSASGLVSPGQ
jgi:hypothetical protein